MLVPRNDGTRLLNEFVPAHVDPTDAPAIIARWYLFSCYTSRPVFIDHKSETYPIDRSTLQNLCLAERVKRITCLHYDICFYKSFSTFFSGLLLKSC